MIIGFSRYGCGGSGPALDYLTGYLVNGEARDPKPEVVRGDPRLVAEIIDSLPFQYRYSSGVLSFAAEDRVTPEIQKDVMDRFESTVFAGLPADRRSIVWIKHQDKGRTELHFVVPRVDLGTGKSLNIAPPTPASRHLLDTLREGINRRYGFRDPTDPECARSVSVPAHIAKLTAQAKRLGRAAKIDFRQAIAGHLEAQAIAGVINSRADVVAFLKQQGFTITRTGVNSLTVARPDTGERVRLKGNIFREHFRPQDLERTPRRYDPTQLLVLDRRLERLVEKRADYHRARYGVEEKTVDAVHIKEEQSNDRTRNASHQRAETIGATMPPTRSTVDEHTDRFIEAAERWRQTDSNLEFATVRIGEANRAFANDIEPALMRSTRPRRRVVSPYQHPAPGPTAQPAVMQDRDTGFEPEMEMDFT